MQDRTQAGVTHAAATSVDSALASLVTLLAFHDIAADPDHLAREYAPDGKKLSPVSIIRAARAQGLKAKRTRSKIKRIGKVPLPAIATAKDGSFFILAKAGTQSVLVKEANQPAAEWTFAELGGKWSGELILMVRRSKLVADTMTFGLRWFLPVVARYRRLFGEVLLLSFFLQLFALITPLFSQVVIDKVLVHHGLKILDVLVVGLLAIGAFEVVLGGLRTYIFAQDGSRQCQAAPAGLEERQQSLGGRGAGPVRRLNSLAC